MEQTSLWKTNAPASDYPALTGDHEADVVIIGGGITGLTTAYLLGISGVKTILLEAMRVGGGTTGYSTGNLYVTVDENYHHIEKKFNTEKIKAIISSRTAAFNLIEEIVSSNRISCSYNKHPWYFFTENEDDSKTIEAEFEACKRGGLEAHSDDKPPVPFKVVRSLRIDGQAQFNPMQYIKGLATVVAGKVQLFESSPVIAIDEGEKDQLHTIRTAQGSVRAKHVIHATHTPKGVMAIQSFTAPYREYAIAVKLNSGHPPHAICWSFNRPHHFSMRAYQAEDGQEYLIALGEPHKVGQKTDNENCFRNLYQYVKDRFDAGEIAYRWSAQHYRSADSIPYIGRRDKKSNVYIATGFSTDGLVYGTLSAMIITDLIRGKKNPWEDLYDPKRHNPLKTAGDFIKENANVFVQYIKDLPHKSEVESLADVNPGEGKIIEYDDEKYGVYRDEKKKLHIVSAICNHMKCIVHWNPVEKSWDCPCHGSRFTHDGKVIEGPAIADLGKMKPGKET
jgi:glycine/D-amino acid oxidase-like deaminating enzyme/nitrite reductase/ring-hydroxylating ferredoxin subunit